MTQSPYYKKPCLTAVTERKQTGCFFGLPLVKGEFYSTSDIALLGQTSNRTQGEFTAKTRWPDGSIKWVNAFAALNSHESYYLANIDSPSNKILKPTSNTETEHRFSIQENALLLKSYALNLKLACNLAEESSAIGIIKTDIVELNKYCTEARLLYQFKNTPSLNIRLTLTDIRLTNELTIKVRIENTQAAEHLNGTWDLGDQYSSIIENLTLIITGSAGQKSTLHITDEANGEVYKADRPFVTLKQHSSGGDNWQSPVHLNAKNEVAITKPGFELTTNDNATLYGSRAKPWLELNSPSADTLYCCIADFWQNFPTSIAINGVETSIALFPSATELQAGESKQWDLQLGKLSNYPEHKAPSYESKPFYFDREFLNHSNAFPSYRFTQDSKIAPLVQQGVDGPQSFVNKRETCDEYGWRHYGELYADHEAIGKAIKSIFVSHYNNQYDTLMGTTIQSVCEPHASWQDVALPLAKHIEDIDIYNTECDKPEYNGGLFWHTDHYLPASTCTHRTYSKTHTSVYEGHQGGGGPGGQHCYSSGLLMHALLFQDEIAEQKVIQLTRWIRNFYNGGSSIVSRLHRYLNIDLKANQLTNIGIVFPGYRYPLDRGTGNYINSLIDCFELTSEANLMNEAAYVIRNTTGLADDLNERNLDDVENAWFYTIYLQAVIKFLLTKQTLNQNDADYAYARKLLTNYGRWMLENEVPYLSNPDKLEFPTDTWAAQDLRKAIIFRYLAYFEQDLRAKYKAKAKYFYRYVYEKLEHSEEAKTTRCLAILMQNYGQYEQAKQLNKCSIKPIQLSKRELESQGIASFIRLFQDVLRNLKRFSITEEIHWLKIRLGLRVTGRGFNND